MSITILKLRFMLLVVKFIRSGASVTVTREAELIEEELEDAIESETSKG